MSEELAIIATSRTYCVHARITRLPVSAIQIDLYSISRVAFYHSYEMRSVDATWIACPRSLLHFSGCRSVWVVHEGCQIGKLIKPHTTLATMTHITLCSNILGQTLYDRGIPREEQPSFYEAQSKGIIYYTQTKNHVKAVLDIFKVVAVDPTIDLVTPLITSSPHSTGPLHAIDRNWRTFPFMFLDSVV